MEPAYGAGALSDLTPGVLEALEIPGGSPVLALPEARHVVLLLVDGLGERLLRRHAADAPFQRLTYAELATRVTQAAQYLSGLGLQPGERVALLLATR